MIKNYLIAAWRNLLKNKVFSLINLLGFSLGVACTILIFAYVWDETNYDTYHPDNNRLYRVALTRSFPDRDATYATSPPPMGPTLTQELPEVEAFCRVWSFFNQSRVEYEDRVFYEQNVFAADSSFFDLFGVELLEGNPNEALKAPNSLVITEEMNRKYFGDESGLGKSLEIGNNPAFNITGIAKSIPKRSHFKFDFLTSLVTYPISRGTFWPTYSIHTYVRLNSPDSKEIVEEKIYGILEQHMGPQVESILGRTYQQYVDAGNVHAFFLQQVKDIHLTSHFNNEHGPNGDKKYVSLFTVVSLMILGIACFNFMNLSIVNSVKRGKEVAMRKVLGSSRKQLIGQFVTESILITFLAVVLAIIMAYLFLPRFNELADKQISFSDFTPLQISSFLFVIVFVVGGLAGLYPALFISSFDTIKVFKGALKLSHKKFSLRNILIVFQFGSAIFMIIATVFIVIQMNYMMDQKLGFQKERMLVMNVDNVLGDQYEAFINELSNETYVETVSASYHVPGRRISAGTFQAIGMAAEERFSFNQLFVGYDFLDNYKLEVVDGRFYDVNFQSDSTAVVVNESTVRMVGWAPDEVIGSKILITGMQDQLTVIGVVKDFHYASLHEPIAPLVIRGVTPRAYNQAQPALISVKLNGQASLINSVSQIESKWNDWSGGEPFRYSFLDDEFDALYRQEERFSQVFMSFSVLAIAIAIVGVIGLSMFMSTQRKKEIGIRKVLGADIRQIMMILSKEFMALIIIANLIVWPLTYLGIQSWLKNYPYAVSLNVGVFLVIGLAFALIILTVISTITYRAASNNPVEAINYE